MGHKMLGFEGHQDPCAVSHNTTSLDYDITHCRSSLELNFRVMDQVVHHYRSLLDIHTSLDPTNDIRVIDLRLLQFGFDEIHGSMDRLIISLNADLDRVRHYKDQVDGT